MCVENKRILFVFRTDYDQSDATPFENREYRQTLDAPVGTTQEYSDFYKDSDYEEIWFMNTTGDILEQVLNVLTGKIVNEGNTN
jgi:hypothetical protein